jgi:hypothetical protein
MLRMRTRRRQPGFSLFASLASSIARIPGSLAFRVHGRGPGLGFDGKTLFLGALSRLFRRHAGGFGVLDGFALGRASLAGIGNGLERGLLFLNGGVVGLWPRQKAFQHGLLGSGGGTDSVVKVYARVRRLNRG